MDPRTPLSVPREQCANCAGKGEIVALRRACPYGQYKAVRLTCLCCGGSGRVMRRPSVSEILQDGTLPIAWPVSHRLAEEA
jgi:hypothetical protein